MFSLFFQFSAGSCEDSGNETEAEVSDNWEEEGEEEEETSEEEEEEESESDERCAIK